MRGSTVKRLAGKLVHVVPTVLGIVLLNFFLLRLAPGDAADVLAAEAGSATAETMLALRERLGLDQSIWQQLWGYLRDLSQFSLGPSSRFHIPVTEIIGERLPATLTLMLAAFALALAVGLPLGVAMAAWVGRLPDRVMGVVALLFYSVPGFWIGLMLIVLFSVRLGWLPTGGAETFGADLTGLDWLTDRLRHLVLPTVSLALFHVAIYSRITRAAMLEVRGLDLVRTARAKGLRVRTH